MHSKKSSALKIATLVGVGTSTALLPFSLPEKNSITSRRVNRISRSFVSNVFAETSVYGTGCFFANFYSSPSNPCASAPASTSICVVEGDVSTVPLYIKTTPSWTTSQTSVTDAAPFLLNPTPSTQSFPAGTTNTIFTTSFTAPAVSDVDGFKNGILNFSTNFTDPTSFDSTYRNMNVRVEHTLTKSQLNFTNLSADFQQELSNNQTSLDIPTSVTFTSTGSYPFSVIFELSTDSIFSTILQSHTFTNVSSNTPLHYTFTSLSEGSYYWRAKAQEVGAPQQCSGYANADPTISINKTSSSPILRLLASAPSSTPTTSPSPTPSPTPQTLTLLPRTGNSIGSFIVLLFITLLTSLSWLLKPTRKPQK